MRKFLLTLCTLLMAVGSALAQTTVTIADFSNLPTTYGAFDGNYTFTTNDASGLAGVTITVPNSDVAMGCQYVNSSYGNCYRFVTSDYGSDNSHDVVITAPKGYSIRAYSMTMRSNTSQANFVVTPKGGSAVTSSTGGVVLSQSGLSAQTATFSMYTLNKANTLFIPYFTITVVKEATEEQIAAANTTLTWTPEVLQAAYGQVTSSDQYSSNAVETSEGSLAALLDGEYTTYFHSAYNNGPDEDHYLQADLGDGNELQNIIFYFKKRSQNNNNRPTSITISGSNDNSNFTEITTISSGLPTTTSVIDYTSDKVSGTEAYRYFRFTVTATNTGATCNNHVFFTYSEFYLLSGTDDLVNALSLQAKAADPASLTDDDITNIATINTAIANAALARMKAAYIAAYSIDEENLGQLGYPTSAGKTAFETAINAISSLADFETEAATALETYTATIVYPSGTYYIKNNNTGCYAYAKDETEAVTRINTDNTADHTSNNYIWTVSSTDNVFTINNLYGNGFTKANESSFTTDKTTTPTSLVTDPFGDFAGKFYLEGAHNNNVYTTSDGTGYVVSWAYTTSSGSYWVFEEVDNTSLTTYTVTVQNVDAGLNPVELSDGTVLNAGTATIYWNGTMTESDITQNEVTGFSIPETGAIVIDGTTVTITYAPSYETLMTNYMKENNIAAKLALAGSLGYPKTTTESYTNLNTLVTNIASNYTKEGWTNLKAYYTAYIDETDVVLPKANKFYKIMGYATSKYAKAGSANANIPNSTGEASDGSDIWYYNTDNTLINYTNGLGTIETREFADVEETKETSTFQHSTCTATSGVKFGLFEIISNYSGSKYWYSNTSNVDRNSVNNHVNCEWELTEVTSLPVTISTAKYATFYAPVPVTIPEGVTAYVATDEGDYLTLNAINDGIIPAATGVILYADITEATTYDFNITASEGSATSDLTGSVATITKPVDAYYLSNGNSGIGFYKGGSATTLAGFKAYLENGTDGEVKTFRFKDVTAIEALKAAQQAGTTYDLSGRRVQRPVKGIFIQDGKKVVIK